MPKNCCKYFTVSLVPITALTLAILFGCSVVLLPILYEELATRTKYGIVIDAGSAHTDLYVYNWEVPAAATPRRNFTGLVKQIWYCGRNDSLNSYTSHPSDANRTFAQCLTDSQGYVPDSLRPTTGLFLGATAGMRLVRDNDSATADEILEVANRTLHHSGYLLVSGKIISGREEAASGWATANYALQNFSPLTDHPDGSLDLGGASVEIAFVSGHPDIDQQYMSKEVLFNKEHDLYARSYLCYGHNEARSRFLAHLVQSASDTTNVSNPCLPSGVMMNYTHSQVYSLCVTSETAVEVFGFEIPPPSTLEGTVDDIFTFVGTGNVQLCNSTIQEVFNFAACNVSSTCINGSYIQPPVEGHFVGFSGFWYTAAFFEMADNSHKIINQWGPYKHNVTTFCSLNKTEAEGQHPGDPYLFHRCFDGQFILHLLEQGLGFNATNSWSVTFKEKVHEISVGWAMGYLLNQTSSISPTPYYIERPYTAVDLVVGIVILSILCVIFVIFFFLTFYACKRVIRTRSGYTDIA